MKNLMIFAVLALSATQAFAQDAENRTTFYVGAGTQNSSGENENDDTPIAIGIMHRLAETRMIVGFDIAREGTKIDSTWQRDQEARAALSFNALVGGNVFDNGNVKVDGAVLLGLRESSEDCARSYVGWQCHADQSPDVEYKGNFGAVVTVSFDQLVLGVRATGESTQLVVGYRF